MELRPGDPLDVYRLVAELGAGGQGTVWRAVDGDGRAVALKLVDVASARPTDVERLRREAYALARLDHPSLVRCHRLFEDPRRSILGLALDLVDGEALSSLDLDPRLDRPRRLALLRHLADALRHLHAAGIAHRDVKAANVLVRRDFFDRPGDPATVVLVDLGIAVESGNPRPLTIPEGVIGTKDVLAPEALAPRELGPPGPGPERDVFAFGVLAMRLLVGRHPSGLGGSPSLADLRGAYLALATSGLPFPVGVDAEPEAILFRRACALRPADRARDGAALVALLEPTIVEAASVGASPTRRDDAAPTAPRLSSSPTARDEPAPAPPTAAAAPSPPTRSHPPPPTQPAAPWPASPTWPDAPPPPAIAPPPSASTPPRRAAVMVAGVVAVAALVAGVAAIASSASRPAQPAPGPSARSTPPPVTLAPTRPATTDAPLAPPPTCPAGTIAVRVGGGACVDASPVTVHAFRREGGRLEGTADWPGATPAQRAAQTAGCRTLRDGALAVNCVDHAQAARHCASRRARLPSADEWLAAITAGAAPGTAAKGSLHEWTRDTSPSGPSYRRTCAPNATGCEAGNPPEARNDDCGFRCAVEAR